MHSALRPAPVRRAHALPPPRPRLSRLDRLLYAGLLLCAAALAGIVAAAFIPDDPVPLPPSEPARTAWDDPGILYEDQDVIIREPSTAPARP